MKRTYSDCYFCSEVAEEQHFNRKVRWEGKLIVLEDVPSGEWAM